MADGGEVTGFDVVTGATPAERRRNVARAISLGLPELRPQPPRPADQVASIMATGPSFRDAPAGLPWTLAVNGALGLMASRGEAPRWWAGCDPQALVADFLGDPPADTTYLVASVCHPDVFDALAGRQVLLWHVNDDDGSQGYADLIADRPAVVRMSSITLEALELARAFLGFSRTETWGWEGCMRGLRHHATEQRETREVVTMTIGERVIPTTRVWIYEMFCALGLMRLHPRDLVVHGDGLFASALAHCGLIQPQPETVP